MTAVDVCADHIGLRFRVGAVEFNEACGLSEFVTGKDAIAMLAIQDATLIDHDLRQHSVFSDVLREVFKLLLRLFGHYFGMRMGPKLL